MRRDFCSLRTLTTSALNTEGFLPATKGVIIGVQVLILRQRFLLAGLVAGVRGGSKVIFFLLVGHGGLWLMGGMSLMEREGEKTSVGRDEEGEEKEEEKRREKRREKEKRERERASEAKGEKKAEKSKEQRRCAMGDGPTRGDLCPADEVSDVLDPTRAPTVASLLAFLLSFFFKGQGPGRCRVLLDPAILVSAMA